MNTIKNALLTSPEDDRKIVEGTVLMDIVKIEDSTASTVPFFKWSDSRSQYTYHPGWSSSAPVRKVKCKYMTVGIDDVPRTGNFVLYKTEVKDIKFVQGFWKKIGNNHNRRLTGTQVAVQSKYYMGYGDWQFRNVKEEWIREDIVDVLVGKAESFIMRMPDGSIVEKLGSVTNIIQ